MLLTKYLTGLQQKKDGNVDAAKQTFYEAALQRHPWSMIELAKLYYEEGYLEESMRWAMMSYHTYYIPQNKAYEPAVSLFDQVKKKLETGKENKFKGYSSLLATKKVKNEIFFSFTQSIF